VAALAGVMAVIACPGAVPVKVDDRLLSEPPSSAEKNEGTIVVTRSWQRLYRVDQKVTEKGWFWAVAPDDYSFLVSAGEKRPDGWFDGLIMELRVKNGQTTFREVFRHESFKIPQPWHLPDGTAFVTGFQNKSGDYNRTYWLDVDRNPHFIFNCKQGFYASSPLQLPDGRTRTLITLFPCGAQRIGPEEIFCKNGVQVLTRPGSAPEFQCIFDLSYTILPAGWHQTPDGRSAHGVGYYGGTFMDLYFAEDGGFQSGDITHSDPYDHLQLWSPVHLPDGGSAFAVSTSWKDENWYQRWDVRLMSRADPHHPDRTDAGLAFDLLPDLANEEAPRISASMSRQPPIQHRGVWLWPDIVGTASGTKTRTIRLFNPYSLALRSFELEPTPSTAGPKANYQFQFHSTGSELYILETVRSYSEDDGFHEWWVRILDEHEDFFAQTEAQRRRLGGP
jgi:hypothetical protein